MEAIHLSGYSYFAISYLFLKDKLAKNHKIWKSDESLNDSLAQPIENQRKRLPGAAD